MRFAHAHAEFLQPARLTVRVGEVPGIFRSRCEVDGRVWIGGRSIAYSPDRVDCVRNFAGKTAFVTGGASGIGLGISKALLSEGMNVVIGDVNEAYMADARAELGDANVAFVDIDVTDRESVAKAADAVVAAFGPIHVLCNNAGIAGGVLCRSGFAIGIGLWL